MVERLSQASILETTVVSAEAIKEIQLKKLVVNAVINPLTTIFRCQNGELIDNPTMFAVVKLLLEETAEIVRGLMPDTRDSLSDKNLLDHVISVADKTRKNTSSMLQDVNAGRKTEIDYISGYFVREALRMSLSCSRNETLVGLVAGTEVLEAGELLARLRQGR